MVKRRFANRFLKKNHTANLLHNGVPLIQVRILSSRQEKKNSKKYHF